MTENDKSRLAAMLNLLAAAFPPAELTSATYEVWWMVLRNLPIEAVEQAMLEAAEEERKFMPRPGEIRHAVLGLDHLDDEAALAYVEARRAARTGQMDDLEPEARHAVEAVGGRLKLIDESGGFVRNEFDVAQIERRFKDAYRAERKRTAHVALGLPAPERKQLDRSQPQNDRLRIAADADGRLHIGEIEG